MSRGIEGRAGEWGNSGATLRLMAQTQTGQALIRLGAMLGSAAVVLPAAYIAPSGPGPPVPRSPW